MSKRRHNFGTKRFKEKSLFIFHARIALKSLILLFVRLIARGARIGKTHTHTHRQDKYCNPRACAPRVNYCSTPGFLLMGDRCTDRTGELFFLRLPYIPSLSLTLSLSLYIYIYVYTLGHAICFSPIVNPAGWVVPGITVVVHVDSTFEEIVGNSAGNAMRREVATWT